MFEFAALRLVQNKIGKFRFPFHNYVHRSSEELGSDPKIAMCSLVARVSITSSPPLRQCNSFKVSSPDSTMAQNRISCLEFWHAAIHLTFHRDRS
jgi:hypothetical protein